MSQSATQLWTPARATSAFPLLRRIAEDDQRLWSFGFEGRYEFSESFFRDRTALGVHPRHSGAEQMTLDRFNDVNEHNGDVRRLGQPHGHLRLMNRGR